LLKLFGEGIRGLKRGLELIISKGSQHGEESVTESPVNKGLCTLQLGFWVSSNAGSGTFGSTVSPYGTLRKWEIFWVSKYFKYSFFSCLLWLFTEAHRRDSGYRRREPLVR
jgi:hypothetical protein